MRTGARRREAGGRALRWLALMALVVPGAAQGPGLCAQGLDDRAAATAAARTQVERTLRALAAFDLPAFTNGLAPDVRGFDVDLDGLPVSIASRDEAARFAKDTVGVLRAAGSLVSVDIRSVDCRVEAAMAYCLVASDFAWSTPDGLTQAQAMRTSVVLRREAAGWVWVHWHASPSRAPAPPK